MPSDRMQRWIPLNIDDLPDPKTGPFICTNNLNARNAGGRMSHVFLVDMFHQDRGPERLITAFAEPTDRKLWGLTHYQPISKPDAPVDRDLIDLVIAARVVAFEDQSPAALRRLDQASEKFNELIPWGDPE